LSKTKGASRPSYDLKFDQCQPAEAVERYAGDVYIRHNHEVAGGKIVEHRDVLQRVPEKAAHDNRMFRKRLATRPRVNVYLLPHAHVLGYKVGAAFDLAQGAKPRGRFVSSQAFRLRSCL
jgi:hypothetical protein